MNGLQCRLVTPCGTGSNPVIPARAKIRKHTAKQTIRLFVIKKVQCSNPASAGSGSPDGLV